MLVTMKRQTFDSLDPEALGWACMEPTLLQIRGKDLTVKTRVYAQLTGGQQALFMFRVLYDHARNSMVEYYCWVAYLLAQANTWSEVKEGLRFFEDEDMLHVLEDTARLIRERNCPGGKVWRDARPQDLDDDPQLLAAVGRLYAMFLDTAPGTLRRISAYIRSNPDEFVRLLG